MVHTEATLKGLSKPDLIKLVLQLKSEMNSDIKELISKIETLWHKQKCQGWCCYNEKCKWEAS